MKKLQEEYWPCGGLMDEAVKSKIDYTSMDGGEFWSLSEDE
jgi:hypothetical protein